MSTSAATPVRSCVQTPVFSVSPSSFSLQQILINIIIWINIISTSSSFGPLSSGVEFLRRIPSRREQAVLLKFMKSKAT